MQGGILMNSQMNGLFRVLLLIAIVFILGSTVSSYLEHNFSSFSEEELKEPQH